MIAPDYLGDAVYATDGPQGLILTTGHHLPAAADAVIILEPEVIAALERYLERIKADRIAARTT